MEASHLNWRNMPAEILREIFRSAAESDGFSTTRDFALVCKAWVNPAQSVLYSNTTIKTLTQLQAFYNTVNHLPHLGTKVKTFNLNIKLLCSIKRTDHAVNIEIQDLLTKLLCHCLPNLEELNELTLQSYLPALDAFSCYQLKYLQRLSPPARDFTECELANYTTCMGFMKDRVQHISIVERKFRHGDVESNASLYNNQLYGKLNEFTKLTSLHLEKRPDDDINVLEYVLTACKSLKILSYKFDPIDHVADFSSQSNSNPTVDMSTIIPSLDIYDLRCTIVVQSDYRNLSYIIQKFPNLKGFFLQIKRHSLVKLDHHILLQLLKYSDKISTFQADNLRVDKNTISETMRNYWNVNGSHGKWDVAIVFTDFDNTEETCLIDIRHSATCSKFYIKYSTSTVDQHYLNLIEENGIYMKRLALEGCVNGFSSNHKLPNSIITHTITHCLNLKELRVVSCTFTQLNSASVDLGRKASLDLLDLKYCNLNEDTLRQVSPCLHRLEELRMSLLFNIRMQRSSEISMGCTKIGRIKFEDLVNGSALYLKLFAADRKEYSYYCFKKNLNVCSEQEYMNENNNIHLSISCQNAPHFYI